MIKMWPPQVNWNLCFTGTIDGDYLELKKKSIVTNKRPLINFTKVKSFGKYFFKVSAQNLWLTEVTKDISQPGSWI